MHHHVWYMHVSLPMGWAEHVTASYLQGPQPHMHAAHDRIQN